MTVKLDPPELQISFALALSDIREKWLQDALAQAIGHINIPDLDAELSKFVDAKALSSLASHGLRGEWFFPVPLVLVTDPHLIAYYRLLYGFSRKSFYATQTGCGKFTSMEDKGVFGKNTTLHIEELCKEMCAAGFVLLQGIGGARVTKALLDDLTLLTLGAQLRGGANVAKGTLAIVKVFEAIHSIVSNAVINSTPSSIELVNAAGRKVWIEFAADPDIIIREEMAPGKFASKIAIEVKGGSDFSNIHNRVGEAEKSHQKAKGAGYVECWTVVNVDKIDISVAQQESPTTNRFYKISDITAGTGAEYDDFRQRIIGLTGIVSNSS